MIKMDAQFCFVMYISTDAPSAMYPEIAKDRACVMDTVFSIFRTLNQLLAKLNFVKYVPVV